MPPVSVAYHAVEHTVVVHIYHGIVFTFESEIGAYLNIAAGACLVIRLFKGKQFGHIIVVVVHLCNTDNLVHIHIVGSMRIILLMLLLMLLLLLLLLLRLLCLLMLFLLLRLVLLSLRLMLMMMRLLRAVRCGLRRGTIGCLS